MVAGEHRRPERHRLRAGGEPPQCPGPDRLRGTAALSLRRARLLAGAGLAGGRGSSAGEVPLELAAHADDRLAPRALHLAAPDARSGVRQCRGRAGLAAEWLLYFPRAAWEGWLPSDARWVVLALLGGSILAAWRSVATRRVLFALAALILFQVTFLTIFHHGNLQPRLIVNLAPLVALAAAAWVPAATRVTRVVLGVGAALLLLWLSCPSGAPPSCWQRSPADSRAPRTAMPAVKWRGPSPSRGGCW